MEDIFICNCMEVRESVIKKAILNGADTLEAIQELTDGGTVCGGCIPLIEDLLEEYLNKK